MTPADRLAEAVRKLGEIYREFGDQGAIPTLAVMQEWFDAADAALAAYDAAKEPWTPSDWEGAEQ